MQNLYLISMLFCFLVALTSASSIVQFTPDNENEILDGTKNVLIKFVAPVSGYGRKNSPKYELVAKLMKQHSDKVVIAEADADKYVPLGYKYGINGFPSFKWYPVGSKSTDDIKVLDLGVEVLDILAFLKKETGIKVKVAKKELAAVAGVVKITPENVNNILDGSKHVLVKFFGSCGFYL